MLTAGTCYQKFLAEMKWKPPGSLKRNTVLMCWLHWRKHLKWQISLLSLSSKEQWSSESAPLTLEMGVWQKKLNLRSSCELFPELLTSLNYSDTGLCSLKNCLVVLQPALLLLCEASTISSWSRWSGIVSISMFAVLYQALSVKTLYSSQMVEATTESSPIFDLAWWFKRLTSLHWWSRERIVNLMFAVENSLQALSCEDHIECFSSWDSVPCSRAHGRNLWLLFYPTHTSPAAAGMCCACVYYI